MIISGIDRQFINVPSLDEALDFYQRMVGMSIVAKGDLDPIIIGDLWGLPKGTTGRSVCLRNAKQSTSLELVQLDPTPVISAREQAEIWDHGLFDLAFLVSDAAKVERMLVEKGRGFVTHPYHYPPWPTGEDVIEALVYGPSRELIVYFELLNPPVPDFMKLDGDFWTLFDMAQIVDDVDSALVFYRDTLGLQMINDHRFPPGFLDEFLHLPKDTKSRLTLFNHPESNGPALELLAFSIPGRTLDISPAKLGIFTISFESSDLDADLARIKQMGYRIMSGPVTVKTALHGMVKAADVEGPCQVRIELFQKE